MKKLIKNNKGITIVALVITIIIMLILAGTTINLTMRGDGIFNQALEAKEKQQIAGYQEKIELARVSVSINNMGEVTLDNLIAQIYKEKIVPDRAITKLDEEKAKMITKEGYVFIITAKKAEYAGKGEKVATPPDLQDGDVVFNLEPDTWTNGSVKVSIEGKIKDEFTLQYSLDAVNWEDYTRAIEITENRIIYACIRNAIGERGSYSSSAVTKIDKLAPQTASITGMPAATLSSQIDGSDYGKYIDYSVIVEGTVLDDWRVFYNDKTTGNVYIILDGYLPNTLIPEETEVITTGTTYEAWWGKDNTTCEEVVAILKNTTYWSVFAEGLNGATATGAPTNKMFVNSWNENPTVNSTILVEETATSGLTDSSKLYIPYTTEQEGCIGYWLASINSNFADSVRNVWTGGVSSGYFYGLGIGIRPVVCLPSGITGIVGDTVELGELITTDNPAEATVTLSDNESGVDVENSRYVYTQTKDALGIMDVSLYTNSFATNPQTITLNVKTEGTYYLHVLTVDNAGNKKETISSAVTVSYPTLASKAKPGDYVEYDAGNGYTGAWQVLYNDSTYDLQIISTESVKAFYFGSTSEAAARTAYNNAVNTLNTECRKYINTSYATSGRCVGSNPISPDDVITSYQTLPFSYNGSTASGFKVSDTNYVTDYNAMKSATNQSSAGLSDIGRTYWLASRLAAVESTYAYFNVRVVIGSLDANNGHLWGVINNGHQAPYNYGNALRPVITLAPDIQTSDGDGSKDSAFKLVAK